MHKILFALVAALASVGDAASQLSSDHVRMAITNAGGPERFLGVIAASTAKMSGQMLDDQTQITGSVANDRSLFYYLRLVNFDKADLADLAAVRRKIASMLSPSICTAPIASLLINEHGVKYKYMAYSKSREYLFEYSFNRETCSPGYRW